MQINRKLVESLKIQPLNKEVAVAAALYPLSGSFIDVSRFERFAFLIAAGALNSALTLQVQQATAVDGTPKDVTDAVVVVAATDDDQWFVIEVQTAKMDINNDYRYVTLKATGAADSDDFAAITFFGYGDYQPIAQGDTLEEAVFIGG
jgi:hypothetical protein